MTIEQALAKFITVLIDPLIKLVFAAALLLFFWGLFQMIITISNGDDAKEGKRHMFWGLVGMIIMFSVGGIIGIVNKSIGAGGDSRVEIQGGFR